MLHQRVAGRRRQAGDRPLQPQLELPPVGLRPIDVDVLGTPVADETAGVRHLIGVVVVEVHNRRTDALVGERGLDADVRRTRAFDSQTGRRIRIQPAEALVEGRRLDALADVAEHFDRGHSARLKRQQEPAGRELRAEERVVALLAVHAAADRAEPPFANVDLLLHEEGVVVERGALLQGVRLPLPVVPRTQAVTASPGVVALVPEGRPPKRRGALERKVRRGSRRQELTGRWQSAAGRQRQKLRPVDHANQSRALREDRVRRALQNHVGANRGVADRVARHAVVAKIVERRRPGVAGAGRMGSIHVPGEVL